MVVVGRVSLIARLFASLTREVLFTVELFLQTPRVHRVLGPKPSRTVPPFRLAPPLFLVAPLLVLRAISWPVVPFRQVVALLAKFDKRD